MRNACGQRALARVLGLDARDVHARHPPDTPFALLGTTPWGLERAARRLGGTVRRVRGEPALREALREGPVVLLLDNARLGGRFGYHWAVAEALTPEGVQVALLAAGPATRIVPWSELRRAWRSWMPGAYRELGLQVAPRGLRVR